LAAGAQAGALVELAERKKRRNPRVQVFGRNRLSVISISVLVGAAGIPKMIPRRTTKMTTICFLPGALQALATQRRRRKRPCLE
jgi:hypothetical protein